MAVIRGADIVVLPSSQRQIYNVAMIEESDFDFLESIWPIYCDGRTLHKVTDLVGAPYSPGSPDRFWLEDEDGLWYNPDYEPPANDD